MNTLRPKAPETGGFTLLELLVVLGIVGILAAIAVMSISGVKGSLDVTSAAYNIQGVLNQARSAAMASNTYVWVGFFEESATNPGVTGTGQVVIAVVSSADGTKLNASPNPTASAPINSSAASLIQVARLMKIANLHLDTLSAAAVPRPSVPAATYQVASTNFQNDYYFVYPIGSAVGAAGTHQFKNIIQFDPQGDATRVGDSLTPEIEIGLRPSHGTTVATTSADVAAIQVGGIGGVVTLYRP